MSAKEPYSEIDALRAALDVAARKSGRQPAWLHGAPQPRQPARTEPEAARPSGADLIAILHPAEPEPDEGDDDDIEPPAAARRYGHLMPGDKREATRQLDAYLDARAQG